MSSDNGLTSALTDVQSWGEDTTRKTFGNGAQDLLDQGRGIGNAILPGSGEAESLIGLKSTKKTTIAGGDGLAQTASVERNIAGGAAAGAIDPQTRQELANELATGNKDLASGGNNQTYEDRAARGIGIQARLDEIAAGKDLTVNDRIRLNKQLMTLQDRPGRQGLLTSG